MINETNKNGIKVCGVKSTKNQKGFTLIEVVIAIVVIGILASFVVPRIDRLMDGKDVKVITDHILDFSAAAKSWKATSPNYTGVSMTVLTGAELVDPTLTDGVGKNPVGGNYTVAASGNNMVVTATGLTDGMCESVRKKLVNAVVSATCASGTVTITMR